MRECACSDLRDDCPGYRQEGCSLGPKPAKTKSDGGSTSYYQIPEGATELNDLIEAKGMGFALGNIFKACYRLGEKEGTDLEYDIKKIVYFAQERLLPYVREHGRLP